MRDPFGNRSLYICEHAGVFFFASEVKQILAIPGLPVAIDPAAIHKYLTFSFVPGEETPIRGIRRLLPGRVARWEHGRLESEPYFVLRERIDPDLGDKRTACRLIRRRCEEAVAARLADIALKGSQNILPRMERMANGWGLDARTPLFDRGLAVDSFRLPPTMKLHGACEKYVLKLILQKKLPREVVWRRKFGMSVPITDWALGPLAPTIAELLGPAAIARRGLFREDYVLRLRSGQNDADETRRRRIGERLWTLAILEAWLQIFIDGRGRRPTASWGREVSRP